MTYRLTAPGIVSVGEVHIINSLSKGLLPLLEAFGAPNPADTYLVLSNERNLWDDDIWEVLRRVNVLGDEHQYTEVLDYLSRVPAQNVMWHEDLIGYVPECKLDPTPYWELVGQYRFLSHRGPTNPEFSRYLDRLEQLVQYLWKSPIDYTLEGADGAQMWPMKMTGPMGCGWRSPHPNETTRLGLLMVTL